MTNFSNIVIIGKIKTPLEVTSTETPNGNRNIGEFIVTVSRKTRSDGNDAIVNNDYIVQTYSERTISDIQQHDVEEFIAVVGQVRQDGEDLRISAERVVFVSGTAQCIAVLSAWGRVTKPPELRAVGADHSVANISVAINHDADHATYINAEVWDKQAELMSASLTKGSPVLVTGDVVPRKYKRKNGEPAVGVNIINARIGFTAKKAQAVTETDGDLTPVDHPEDLPF